MAYTEDKQPNGLDALTDLASGDILVAGDITDSNRLKGITYTNLQTSLNTFLSSSTQTLTNKTFDANGTGNSISNIDLTADVIGIAPSTNGGTSNGFTKFTGATTAEKTYTLPDANATILYSGGDAGTPSAIVLTNASGTITNITLVTPALGTPSSGTLTSCTGLPLTGLVDDTTTALGVGTLELGHASDTSIARVSAGVISVEGVTIPSISSTNTLTNKRITNRVSTEASAAEPTINTDNVDAHSITALAAAITSMTTNLSGTPTNFQKLIIRIKDNATGRAITWGASFEARGVALPTTTTASKVLTVGFIYDTVTSKWGCVASADEA